MNLILSILQLLSNYLSIEEQTIELKFARTLIEIELIE